MIFALALLVVAAVWACRALWRRRRTAWIDQAARAAYVELVAAQVADDSTAVLPPTVNLSEAIAYAGRHGLSVAEAAEAIYVSRARGIIARNARRHARRLRPKVNP